MRVPGSINSISPPLRVHNAQLTHFGVTNRGLCLPEVDLKLMFCKSIISWVTHGISVVEMNGVLQT